MTEVRPTTVYAVRHGETQWNLVGKQQGHLDSALTDRGRCQAEALAQGLAGRGIEVVYSSDLGRALKTAEIVGARLKLPVQADVRLREHHFGLLQGLTYEAFRERYPEERAGFESGSPDYCFPGGQSARQHHDGIVARVAEIARRHTGQTVLIVAHGGVLRSLFNEAVRLSLSEPRRFSLFNVAINRFSVCGDVWRLDTWGDIAHLGEMDTLDDS